jgi:uncharacterized protein (DUF58 family)
MRMAVQSSSTSDVYVELPELMKLEHYHAGFSLLPRQPVHSVLAGQHASHLRGRGLDFLELRAYQTGDDIRNIDWKVTARTRKPYTRIFTEERERPVLLIVDQRQTMFFGSKLNLKSVTAAETAAMAIWRVLKAKDRIGAVVFNDAEIRCIRPQRSRATGLQILKTIADFNRALSWNKTPQNGGTRLNEALRKASGLATHDYLVCLITDGAGIDAQTRRLCSVIAEHNDLLFAYVYDPLEVDLPTAPGLVVSDGARQMELKRDDSIRRRFRSDRDALLEEIRRFWIGREVSVLRISAAEPTAPQLRRLLTIGTTTRSRR